MISEEGQSLRRLERRRSRTLVMTGLRFLGSEGNVGRLRRRYLRAAAARPDVLILQVGANDGIFSDPLYPFFLRHPHVRGILIEPQREPFDKLVELYRDNANVTCVNTAIAPEAGEITLWSVDLGSDPFGKSLARAKPERFSYAMWRRPHLRLKGYKVVHEIVPAVTLKEAIEGQSIDPGKIDALFTDTEGSDIEVVNQLLETGARPQVIQYEHVIASDDAVLDINQRLAEHGYELSWSFRDVFAVRNPD
jgi:FkbM family methyltransferase